MGNVVITSKLPHEELADKFYVYVYSEHPRKPIYVGKGYKDRANTHYKEKSHNKVLNGRIRNLKRRKIEPEIRITHLDSEKEAFELETFLISEIGRMDLGTGPLLNFTDGGEGDSGFVMTEKTKAKISAALKGHDTSPTKTPEAIAKMRKSLTGRKLSPEHREKVIKALTGRPCSEETRAKISAANTGKSRGKGRKLTEEHKAKLSAARKGIKFTEEHKAKLSAARKGCVPWNKGKKLK